MASEVPRAPWTAAAAWVATLTCRSISSPNEQAVESGVGHDLSAGEGPPLATPADNFGSVAGGGGYSSLIAHLTEGAAGSGGLDLGLQPVRPTPQPRTHTPAVRGQGAPRTGRGRSQGRGQGLRLTRCSRQGPTSTLQAQQGLLRGVGDWIGSGQFNRDASSTLSVSSAAHTQRQRQTDELPRPLYAAAVGRGGGFPLCPEVFQGPALPHKEGRRGGMAASCPPLCPPLAVRRLSPAAAGFCPERTESPSALKSDAQKC